MKDNRSLWTRFSEKAKTLVPIEPASYKARSLSIEAQRDNAIKWLNKQSEDTRSRDMVKIEQNLPSHLLEDVEFGKRFAKLHENNPKRIDAVLPLEVTRSTDYLVETNKHSDAFICLLNHDESKLGIPLTPRDKALSDEDKAHAVEVAKSFDAKEALNFISANYYIYDYDDNNHKFFSDEVLTDPDYLTKAMGEGFKPHQLPAFVLQDDNLMEECIRRDGSFYLVASKELRNDFDLCVKAINNSEHLAGAILAKASNELRNDKQLVEYAVSVSPSAIFSASRELRKDKAFILEMTEKHMIDIPHRMLVEDRDVALNLTKTESVRLNQLPEHLQENKSFVLNVVRLNSSQLEFATDRMKDDPEVVLKAMEQNPAAYLFASDRVQHLRSVAIEAVNGNRDLYEHLPEEMRRDEYVTSEIEYQDIIKEHALLEKAVDKVFETEEVEKEAEVQAPTEDYRFSGGTPVGVVSFGDVGRERQLQNVATGVRPTDAVAKERLDAAHEAINFDLSSTNVSPAEQVISLPSKTLDIGSKCLSSKIRQSREEQGLPLAPVPKPVVSVKQNVEAPSLKPKMKQ